MDALSKLRTLGSVCLGLFLATRMLFAQPASCVAEGMVSFHKNRASKLAASIAAAAMERIEEDPLLSESQKEQLKRLIKPSQSPTEVRDVIASLGPVVFSEENYWGVAVINMHMDMQEISGCWHDKALASFHLPIYRHGHLLVGRADSAIISHTTGPRCAGSDQGAIVTDDSSVTLLALGFESEDSRSVTFMLEGDDVTHWTLKSGGEVGSASLLKLFIPNSYASDAAVGGMAGMGLKRAQIQSGETFTFQAEIAGNGGTMQATSGVYFQLAEDGKQMSLERQQSFVDAIQDARGRYLKSKSRAD